MMQAVTVVDRVMVVLFFLALVPSLGFAVLYLFRPWRATSQGVALMVKSWGNVFLLGLGFLTLVFGRDFWGRDEIRLVGMSAFTLGLWLLFRSLLTAPGARDYPPFRWRRKP